MQQRCNEGECRERESNKERQEKKVRNESTAALDHGMKVELHLDGAIDVDAEDIWCNASSSSVVGEVDRGVGERAGLA